MNEWDLTDNCSNPRGFFTIYTSDYENDIDSYVRSLNCRKNDAYIDTLCRVFERTMEEMIHRIENQKITKEELEYDLIGINSNSFTENTDKHNIFMEWDTKEYIPPMEQLLAFGGTIVKTAGGIHLIKEANLDFEDLINLLSEWRCCSGYIHYSKIRKHCCLRVCPKVNNHLDIQTKEDCFLIEVYEKVTKKLKEVYNELVGQ